MDILGRLWELVHGHCLKEMDILRFEIDSLSHTLDMTCFELEKLKEKHQEDTSTIPTFLKVDNNPFKPSVLVFERGLSYWVQIAPEDMYAVSPSLEKLVEQKGLRSMSLNKKLNTIWTHVILHSKYRYDQSESWEYPTTTHYRKFGDCEDTTIYFITLCRLAGVPADRVFNAVGKMGSIGHSFPVVKMEDDKWYIMETTLSTPPKGAMLFKDSEYRAGHGLYNWKFQGKIDNEEKQV